MEKKKECLSLRIVGGKTYPQIIIQKQLSYLGLKPGDPVEVYVENGAIIIKRHWSDKNVSIQH